MSPCPVKTNKKPNQTRIKGLLGVFICVSPSSSLAVSLTGILFSSGEWRGRLINHSHLTFREAEAPHGASLRRGQRCRALAVCFQLVSCSPSPQGHFDRLTDSRGFSSVIVLILCCSKTLSVMICAKAWGAGGPKQGGWLAVCYLRAFAHLAFGPSPGGGDFSLQFYYFLKHVHGGH